MATTTDHPIADHYILATGKNDVERLRLLHAVYGPGTEAMLHRAGLQAGMHVAEIGCGSGNIACWTAAQVGPTGTVVAIDRSPEQIEQAADLAAQRGLTNIEFRVADAYEPGLAAEAFDLVYCRLVLSHLTQPRDAVLAMRSLVKPGGRLACEELDVGCWLCDPPASAMRQYFRWCDAIAQRRGENFRLGASLHRLFQETGFAELTAGSNFPLAIRGVEKRLLWMTFVEFAQELVQEGIATQIFVDRVAEEMKTLADDETTLFGFPLLVQAIGVR